MAKIQLPIHIIEGTPFSGVKSLKRDLPSP